MKVRWLANEWPWLPIWVTTSWARAASTSLRTSHTVRARGFSVYTCLPSCMASTVGSACQWSGVATRTASKDLPALSYISR